MTITGESLAGLSLGASPSANPVLVVAALAAGATRGVLRAAGAPLGALVVSHLAWDAWIFLMAPLQPVGAGPGSGT